MVTSDRPGWVETTRALVIFVRMPVLLPDHAGDTLGTQEGGNSGVLLGIQESSDVN